MSGRAKLIEALRIHNLAQAKTRRTIVPGQIGNVTRQEASEQDADFIGAVPELVAGEADVGTPTPDAPRLNIAGGGFYMLLPVSKGDECVGLVADRATDEWRESREPGLPPVFERVQDDSDVLAAPLVITAPDGAPDSWDGLIVGGPSGVAVDLAEAGAVTITKQGTPVAAITMDQGGSITFDVVTGQSVNGGGPAAVELAKAQIIQALTTAFQKAVTAAAPIVPPNGDGGTAGFTALLSSFQAASAGQALQTLKMKGE